ncbi:MAG TPA: hypothetical protein VFI24_27215 [Pyrinomonadaceae bacterium]|nr:hypothetical protein [Pyrinomonadaceae bacterium]
MDISESKVHSFIVKIWLEDDSDETEKPVWRGHITHVPSGERRYLKKLNDIRDFIERYLANFNGESGQASSLHRFLRRLGLGRTQGPL